MEQGPKDLYQLMEKMIKATEEDKRDEVAKINRPFSELRKKLHSELGEDLSFKYDVVRNDCVVAVGVCHDHYDLFLKDAKQKFKEIPMPK